MSNTEHGIVMMATDFPEWTHQRIADVLRCSRSHVTKTINAWRRGFYGEPLYVPKLEDVVLVLNQTPSDINNDLRKIRPMRNAA